MSGLLLVGCGKMGGALLAGWLARGSAPQPIFVVEPSANAAAMIGSQPGVTLCRAADELPPGFTPDVLLLAVKPQMMDGAVPPYRRFAAAGALVLSIAAGRTIAYYARHFGGDAAIIRAMPNTPAAIGRGITVLCANPRVSAAQRALGERLLAAVGEIAWIDQESLIDPVTAMSGGGPAYVCLLVECMAKAGEAAGLPADLAMRLARATVAGTGELLHRSPEPAATLRQNVTSPGGTTAEALKVLMAPDAVPDLMVKAIAAATRRGRELAG